MMTDHLPRFPKLEAGEPAAQAVHDVAWLPIVMVNAYLVGEPGEGNPWALVDAGITPLAAGAIRRAAARRFGTGTPPQAIVLTHGHFDHVGALPQLAEEWNVPVYAHELELPYLTGQSDYPPPDPTVGGGSMARLSFLYPKHGIDLRGHVRPLPPDGSVPGMPGWRWVHTPGHSPGHVSFFRQADRTLIAGDAFVTQKQESLLGVLSRKQVIHGPPMYFTIDWEQSRDSVRKLADLRPAVALTGHGLPMANPRLAHDLNELARHFDAMAKPRDGRYVRQPARADAGGVVSVPPRVFDPWPAITLGVTALAVGAAVVALSRRGDDA